MSNVVNGNVAETGLLKGNVSTIYGKDGESAYEIALNHGFEGSEKEWVASLKGETGNSGVYLGSGDMPEDCNVQIDPNGQSLDMDTIVPFLEWKDKTDMRIFNFNADATKSAYLHPDGKVQPNPNYRCTEFLPVKKGDKIKYKLMVRSDSVAILCFYENVSGSAVFSVVGKANKLQVGEFVATADGYVAACIDANFKEGYLYKDEAADVVTAKISEATEKRVAVNVYDGRVVANANRNAPTTANEKYTCKLFAKDFDKLYTRLTWVTEGTITRKEVAICKWYMDGSFDRKLLLDPGVVASKVSSFEHTYTFEENIEYICFTYYAQAGCDIEIFDKSVTKRVLAKDNTNTGYAFNSHTVKGINHRGWYKAPENTLSAFKASKANGFSFVECDVAVTSDGVPVLLHDWTINRTSNVAGDEDVYVYNKKLYELRTLDFNWSNTEDKKKELTEYSGEKIPTFEEFIILCRNLGLYPYIELKTTTDAEGNAVFTYDDVKTVVSIIQRYNMVNNCTIISFYAPVLRQVVALDGNIRVGFNLASSSVFSKDNDWLPGSGQSTSKVYDYNRSLNWIFHILNMKRNNEVFINLDQDCLTDAKWCDYLQLCKDKGVPLELWTVNTEEELESLDPYISGVTSDMLNYEEYLHNGTIATKTEV